MKIYPKAVLSLITGPIRTEIADNGQTILTHLQKYSHFGFMVTWPFCFHFWIMWRLQEYINQLDSCGVRWLPGTEQGIYFRTPGFRWDRDLGMIWTWGYFGLHLD